MINQNILGDKHKSGGVSLSVFMPFYNEEANIGRAIAEMYASLRTIEKLTRFEVIIIDDGSTDATKQKAHELVPLYENLSVISHEHNKGYGGAIMTGIQNSKFEYVFFTDGDLQFDVREIATLLTYVPEWSAVIGYRTERKDSFMRIVNAQLWNRLNTLFYGIHVKDINCAFKLFKRELLTGLPLLSKGAMISSEILIRLTQQGVRFIEVPVTHLPRLYGKQTGSRLGVIFKALKEFVTLYLQFVLLRKRK